VWDSGIATSARNAALANGALAHALDFDDNNMSMIGHSSAPVVPAVFALADENEVTLADVIVAYIVGVQVESVLGRRAGLEHNARGWHTTSTLGTFGAAAASARLLELDAPRVRDALGIAVSMSSGVRQNFPSMTKAVHAGIAAQNGVTAAKLAQAGVRSAPDALEGAEGFLALFAGGPVASSDADEFASFEILESFPKVYPTCSMVHQALDVLLAGIQSGEVQPQQVTKLECEASYHALNIMRYPDPQDTPQARFSMQYCLAVALLQGAVTNEWFNASRIHSPAIRDTMRKIEVRVAPDQATKQAFERMYLEGRAATRVKATHTDGRVFRGEASLQKGHPGNPLDVQGFHTKFLTCVAPRRGEAEAANLWSVLVQGNPQARFRPASHLARTGS
jgi:2-methylcitrate dehydratase PrpD